MRRYDYKCLECGKVFELQHSVDQSLDSAHCPTCAKIVPVEKLISSGTTFKIMWNTKY